MGFIETVMQSLRDDVDKAAIQKAWDTEKTSLGTENLRGLIEKNNELLAETKKAKQDARELKEQYQVFEEQEVTPEVFLQMKNELEALQGASGSANLEEQLKAQSEKGKKAKEDEIRPALERKEKELAELQSNATEYKNRYQDFRAKNELKSAIDKLHLDVDDFWFEGMYNRCKVEFNDDDKMNIGVYHEGGHIPLEDWMNIFPESELGKKYVKAPLNTGGAASGSNASGRGATLEDIRSGKLDGAALDAYLAEQGYIS